MSEKNYSATIIDGKLVITIDLNQCNPELTTTGKSATFFTTGKYYDKVIDQNTNIEYGLNLSVFTKDRYIIENLRSQHALAYTQKATPAQATPPVTPAPVTPPQATPPQATPPVTPQAIDINQLILSKLNNITNQMQTMQTEINELKTTKKSKKA